jgi:hypothetical protein
VVLMGHFSFDRAPTKWFEHAQGPPGSLIRFEIENSTLYIFDCPDSQLGTNPNKLDRAVGASGIGSAFAIGDIVSVNGTPVNGTSFESVVAGLTSSPNPAPGRPITNVAYNGVIHWDLDFQTLDGTRIGSIHLTESRGADRFRVRHER